MSVPGVCAYPKKLEKVAADNVEAKPPSHWSHHSTRRLYRLTPPIAGLWPTFTHTNCVCNEIVSATNRVLGEVPLPTDDGLRMLQKQSHILSRRIGKVQPISVDEFVNSYVGRRRKRYEIAAELYDTRGVSKRDAYIEAFIKSEKFNPYDKLNPDPRMIQARKPVYNVGLGIFLKPMEHKLYKIKGPTGLRCIAKGLNPQDRGRLVAKKFDQFENPVVLSIDGSRWDKHITRGVLKVEHSAWNWCCNDPVLRRLLAMQFRNRVRCQNGTRYVVDANRMSGDFNTALGNVFLMTCMVYAAMKELGVKRWDFLDDGDDCLIFVDACEEYKLAGLSATFLKFGQEVKLENRATVIEEITFCQCRPVKVNGVYTMVRNWRKALSQDCCGVKRWDVPNLVRDMLTAIGMCNIALHSGVPILQSWGLACLRNGSGQIPKGFEDDEALAYRLGRGYAKLDFEPLPVPISEGARESFAMAFGVDIWEQIDIENKLDAWTVDITQAAVRDLELDYRWKLNVDLRDPCLAY